jgi:hypothetical protein
MSGLYVPPAGRAPLGGFNTAILGTPPDYTEFEADGTMEAHGEATTWKDELGPILASRIESPSSDIVQNLAEGSITFEASARYPTDYVVYNIQINHDWLQGSDLGFHIHWWQTVAELANWLIGYRYQANGQAKDTIWKLLPVSANAFTWASGTLNQISGFGALTLPGTYGVSDIVQVRLHRDYTNVSGEFSGAETSGLDLDVMSADIHKILDMLGSRQEYVK